VCPNDEAIQHQRNRHSVRLPGYDYSKPGAYFVTLVTYQRERLFGDIVQGEVRLSDIGQIVVEEWLRSAQFRGEIELDMYVVMPNHLHGLVIITRDVVGAHGRAPLRAGIAYRPSRSLGSMIAGFKSAATKRINEMRATPGLPVWQRNYHERVIRNEAELNSVRQYILDNPQNWSQDAENR
jgi:REP element-mobilizing transposase RayT